MSVHSKDGRYAVRWREDGKQRSRSFATHREAHAFNRDLMKRRDRWRDSIGGNMPDGAITLAQAATCGDSFQVTEVIEHKNAWEDDFNPIQGSRAVHEGFFPTVAAAEHYRQLMPDADHLEIAVLYDRFLLRHLSEDEIAAGEREPDDYENTREQIRAQRRS